YRAQTKGKVESGVKYLKEAKAKNASLSREVTGKVKASGDEPDLRKLRGKVDSLLEKIEALEL
ncbi:hypothetical protein H8E52_12975, partial [bacterium]|nr:hypothetical protein [bacterium]